MITRGDGYLNGDLRPANADAKSSDIDVPTVAEAYAQNACRMARVQIAKASKRLAASVADGLAGKTDAAAKESEDFLYGHSD